MASVSFVLKISAFFASLFSLNVLICLFQFRQGGDSSTKRAKFDQEAEWKVNDESRSVERNAASQENNLTSTQMETPASTSNIISSDAGTEKSGYDQLPKEMNEMKIRDDKSDSHDDKVKSVEDALQGEIVMLLYLN